MIPIIFDSTEQDFSRNGLGRLRDCISCVVTEERNGIYECDFEYPVDGANYNLIQIGRIIGVTHDDTGTIQPFDIVAYTKPIEGVVTFHCVHISYRLSGQTVVPSGINSLAAAFTLFGNVSGTPFSYQTDKTSPGYLPSADGIPKTVRSMLGGTEGSILDTYGGEYEWDKWTVILHSARGQLRDFSIRYGVNMLNYEEEVDSLGTYSSCIPYWTDGVSTVVGDKQSVGELTVSGRDDCVPLDVSEKFESKPTKAQVNAMGLSVMNSKSPTVPVQNIHVEFVRLQDMGYVGFDNLLICRLCDTINVYFPDYGSSGKFKIVKTVWDVLEGKYESMELGDLSMSLSEALGIDSSSNDKMGVETITPSITVTTGTLVSCSVRQFGNVVQMLLTVRNSASVAAGGNIFAGTLNTTALRPLIYTTGGGYYGAHAVDGSVGTSGALVVRNASSSAVTISGDNTASVSLTYIVA